MEQHLFPYNSFLSSPATTISLLESLFRIPPRSAKIPTNVCAVSEEKVLKNGWKEDSVGCFRSYLQFKKHLSDSHGVLQCGRMVGFYQEQLPQRFMMNRYSEYVGGGEKGI